MCCSRRYFRTNSLADWVASNACAIAFQLSLLRSSKNAFIMQSKSTFLEFLDGDSSLQIWQPRKILQGQILKVQMTSLQSTMCFVCLTFSFTYRKACLSSHLTFYSRLVYLCFLAVWTVIKEVALFTFEDTVIGILRTGLS